jgi:hypothetical protein
VPASERDGPRQRHELPNHPEEAAIDIVCDHLGLTGTELVCGEGVHGAAAFMDRPGSAVAEGATPLPLTRYKVPLLVSTIRETPDRALA